MSFRWITMLAATLVGTQVLAADAVRFSDFKDQQSYAIGAQTGRTLKKDNVEINVELLVRGLRDALAGEPLQMSEADLRAVMNHVQQDLHKNLVLNRRMAGERNLAAAVAYLADNGKQPGVVTTASGLQYRIIKAGSGRKPALIDTVAVNYRGTRPDGFEFEASQQGKPATIVVAQAIPGWKEALLQMPVGAHWQLMVPPNLAYSDRGSGADIGPNQLLLFDLELVDVK